MEQPQKSSSPVKNAGLVILTLAIAVLGYFHFEELQKPAEVRVREIVKEVPIETVKEVIKEVEKEIKVPIEVPAELTDFQKLAINFASRYISAPRVEDLDEVFYEINSFRTKVILGDAIKEVVTEDRLRNKLELILRRNGISIDSESSYTLMFYVDGLWSSDQARLTYQYNLQLLEDVVLSRNGSFRVSPTYTWEEGSFGYVGKSNAEDVMIENVESIGEAFANKYLTTQEKEKRKIEQDSGYNSD